MPGLGPAGGSTDSVTFPLLTTIADCDSDAFPESSAPAADDDVGRYGDSGFGVVGSWGMVGYALATTVQMAAVDEIMLFSWRPGDRRRLPSLRTTSCHRDVFMCSCCTASGTQNRLPQDVSCCSRTCLLLSPVNFMHTAPLLEIFTT